MKARKRPVAIQWLASLGFLFPQLRLPPIRPRIVANMLPHQIMAEEDSQISFKDRCQQRLQPASESSGRIFFFAVAEVDEEEERYSLDRCSLCRKRIAMDENVFMYRGNVPFCSDECREERIELDAAKESSKRFAMKSVASSRKETRRKPSTEVNNYIDCRSHAATTTIAA